MPSSFLTRRRLAIAGLAAAALGALVAHPGWAQSLGVDVWNVPALQKELRAGEDQERELTERNGEVRRRIAVKDAIIADLLAGRITLAGATERFAVLNSSRPEYMAAIRAAFPGETDREKLARNVIAFAALRVAPEQRQALDERLESELQEMTGLLAAE